MRSGHPSVVIAGGGTGGHLMPGLAVAQALREAGAQRITFIGTARGLETRLVPEAGYELRLVAIGGLKGMSWGRKLISLRQLPQAMGTCAAILRETEADVVLGIGGYASGPALAAAGLLRRPVVVLEVNARVGLANRLAAPWVHSAAVNFPESALVFRRARRVEVTGIPVRRAFSEARQGTHLTAHGQMPTVLIFGGSQGAHAINEVVGRMVEMEGLRFRIRHQTGAADYEATAAAYRKLRRPATAAAFIPDMAAAMAEADMVVCRAGASTLGELAAAGRAAVLIPFPGAADQHQLRNAEAYADAGAAVLIEQNQLGPERLRGAIERLLGDPVERSRMEERVRSFAHPQAAQRIAALVLEAGRKQANPMGRA